MSQSDWQNNTLPKLFPEVFKEKVSSILDVGCFVSNKTQYVDADLRVAVDHFQPYLYESKRTTHAPILYIQHDVRELNKLFLAASFDVVVCLDVIEHLTLGEAVILINDMTWLAKKAVIIETPNGLIKQDKDITGLGNHDGQTHRSAWNVEMLETLGFTCSLRDYQMQDVVRHSSGEKCDPNIQIISAYKIL